jgi:hypothetical protein
MKIHELRYFGKVVFQVTPPLGRHICGYWEGIVNLECRVGTLSAVVPASQSYESRVGEKRIRGEKNLHLQLKVIGCWNPLMLQQHEVLATMGGLDMLSPR